MFAWCGDAPSWVRQHRSRNIPRIGVSVLTKHVELPIKRPIRRQAQRCWKSPKRTRNSPRSLRRSLLPHFLSNGSRSRSVANRSLDSAIFRTVFSLRSGYSEERRNRSRRRAGDPRRICGRRPRGVVGRAIPRLPLMDGRSPTPHGWAPSSGHERPARHPVRIYKPQDAFKRVTRKGIGWCGCQARVTCTTGEALFYFQSPVRSLWITCEVSPARRVPGHGTLSSKSALLWQRCGARQLRHVHSFSWH